MSKLNKILLTLILLLTFSYVKADCSEEELTKLKEEADKIEVTFEHLYTDEDDEGERIDLFNLYIKNILTDYYVTLNGEEKKYSEISNDNIITINNLKNGKWKLNIYNNKCTEKIDTIDFKLPKTNQYYYDPLCIGIDGDDFELCGKYYDYNVSYEEFEQRVERYKYLHRNDNIDNEVEKEHKSVIKEITNFILKNKIYVIAGTAGLLIITLIIMLIRKVKNRGVLK